MLQFYLTSILIYAIIIFCTILLFGKNIKENGWFDESKKGSVAVAIIYMFAMSAIPVLRVIVIGGVFLMAGYTKEEYEKTRANRKDDE